MCVNKKYRKRMDLKKIFLLCIGIIALGCSAIAQDWHYSQFYASPLTTNPGNTGVFNGDIRVYTLYRLQWFTVTNPYKTFSVAADAPIFKSKMRGKDFFAAGININNDNQGSAHLSNTSYNATLSFTKYLGGYRKNDVTIGYEIGYVMKSASYGGSKWDSQYDESTGTYNPAYGSGAPGGGGIGFLDMSTGVVWNFTDNHLLKSALGFSFHHFTAPNESITGGSDRLLPKMGAQWNINYKLSETSNTTLEPSIMASLQGSSLLINGGLNVKYVLEEHSHYTNHQMDKAVYFGAFYRFRDALWLTFRIDYSDFAFSFAYDTNISKLTPASKSVGGFEFMLLYKGVFGKNKNAKRSNTRFI